MANGESDTPNAAVRVVWFEFDLADLEADAEKTQANLREIDTILSRYITELRGCYNKYRMLGAPANEHNTRILSRLQFLRLLKDMDIEVLGLSTADANRVIYPVRKSWSLHGAADAILPRDFYEALIRVGWRIFGPTVDPTSSHPIADCLLKLVLRSLAYDSLKGYLFQNDAIAQRLIPHTAKFEQLFLKYAEAGANGDCVLRWREVMFLARDIGLFADFADRSAVPQVVMSLHSNMLAEQCTDMRNEVTVLELMEFFTGCAMMWPGGSGTGTANDGEVVQLEVTTDGPEAVEAEATSEPPTDTTTDTVPGPEAVVERRRSSVTTKFQISMSEDSGALLSHASSPFTSATTDLSRVNELLALVL